MPREADAAPRLSYVPAVKTLGLIGGTTWHSTVEYYRGINEGVAARLGGASSARLILYSVNFAELQPPTEPSGWAAIAEVLSDIARRLERGGAECVLLCANTPHAVADDVQGRIGVPLVHIVDAVADAIVARGVDRVALLGTRPTMELPFFASRLAKRGVATLVPDEEERAIMHATILEELGRGVFRPETRERYLAIIDRLVARGARGAILGCTEIPLLLRGATCSVPTFDTLALHVEAAVRFALD
jgi:aspartate racemase